MVTVSGGATTQELLENANRLCASTQVWKREVGLFLKEWLNDSTYITAHTSGSTGAPKEIKLLKSHVEASATTTCRYFGIDNKSTMLLCMSTGFIAGKLMLVRALMSKANLIIVEPSKNPVRELAVPIDFAAMVPMQVGTCVTESPNQFTQIDTLIIGGAPLQNELRDTLTKLPGKYYCTYGMTETITHVGVSKIGTHKPHHYEAIPPVSFSQDDRGCLVIDLPHMDDLKVVTNDMINLHSNNHFEWLGRMDNVINTGGVKVFPERIEEKLHDHIVGEFFIIGTRDESLGETVTLVYSSQTQIPSEEKLRTLVGQYEIPRKLLQVSEIKYTGSGKIDRIATLNA